MITAGLFGDPGHALMHSWPLWARAPWSSTGQPRASAGAAAYECEPVDMEDITSPMTTIRTPEHRNILEWLQGEGVQALQLTGRKRCDPKVCDVLRDLLPDLALR